MEKVLRRIDFRFSPEENERVKDYIREVIAKAPYQLTLDMFDGEFQNHWNTQWGHYGITIQMVLDSISHDPLDGFRKIRHIGPLHDCYTTCWAANINERGEGTGYIELGSFPEDNLHQTLKKLFLYKESQSVPIAAYLMREIWPKTQPENAARDVVVMTENLSHYLAYLLLLRYQDQLTPAEFNQLMYLRGTSMETTAPDPFSK